MTAFAVRVAAARIALLKGATPSPVPIETAFDVGAGFDVQTTYLSDLKRAVKASPDHLPIFAPRFLSESGTACMVSLLVMGGPNTYSWRYRVPDPPDAGHPNNIRQGDMPSVTRFRFPGGTNKFLLTVEDGTRDFSKTTFGGGAITIGALDEIEVRFRGRWGNEVFDIGRRTAMALSTVYLKPTLEDAEDIVLGKGFEVRRCTSIINGTDLAGPEYRTWDARDALPAPDDDRVFPTEAAFKNPRVIKDALQALWPLLPGRANTAPRFDDFDTTYGYVAFKSHTTRDRKRIDVKETFDWDVVRDTAAANPKARSVLRSLQVQSSSGRTAADIDSIRGDELAKEADKDSPIRNVYGCKDGYSDVKLPYLDLDGMIGLLADAVRPRNTRTHAWIKSDDSIEQRTRSYGAHLHLATNFIMADKDIWPADLQCSAVYHASILTELDPSMQCLFTMDCLSPEDYDGVNYWLLEPTTILFGVTNMTRYAGFGVEGQWKVTENRQVKPGGKNTTFVALEAAVRAEYSFGRSVAAMEMQGAKFSIVRRREGFINALPIAPRILDCDEKLKLRGAGGLSGLSRGSNNTRGFVFVVT